VEINPKDLAGKQLYFHDNYRDFGENGNEEFEYFVKRLLPKLDPRRTKYRNQKEYSQKPYDTAFTISDEAFALLVLDNELEVWNKQFEMKRTNKNATIRGRGFERKYIKLFKKGTSGWTKKGQAIYATLKRQLKEIRKQKKESTDKYWRKFCEEAGAKYSAEEEKIEEEDEDEKWERLYEQNCRAVKLSHQLETESNCISDPLRELEVDAGDVPVGAMEAI